MSKENSIMEVRKAVDYAAMDAERIDDSSEIDEESV